MYIYIIYITENYIVIEIPFHKKLTERFLRAWPKTSSCGGHAERSGFEMGQLLPAAQIRNTIVSNFSRDPASLLAGEALRRRLLAEDLKPNWARLTWDDAVLFP